MPKCINRKKAKNILNGYFICMRGHTNKVKTDNACRNCIDFYPTLMSRILNLLRRWFK